MLLGPRHSLDGATPTRPQPEFERQVRSIQVRFENGRTLRLNLGRMATPLAAMRDCLANLQTSWGLDPGTLQGLTRLAVPKLSTVRRVQRDYPSSMLMNGMSAFLPVRVMVDAEGRTTACVIQIEEVEEEFADAVCSNLARGYEPALDGEGKPAASAYRTSVLYLIN